MQFLMSPNDFINRMSYLRSSLLWVSTLLITSILVSGCAGGGGSLGRNTSDFSARPIITGFTGDSNLREVYYWDRYKLDNPGQKIYFTTPNATFNFSVSAYDPGNLPLIYQWISTGGSFSSANADITGWQAPLQPGHYLVQVEVSNGKKTNQAFIGDFVVGSASDSTLPDTPQNVVVSQAGQALDIQWDSVSNSDLFAYQVTVKQFYYNSMNPAFSYWDETKGFLTTANQLIYELYQFSGQAVSMAVQVQSIDFSGNYSLPSPTINIFVPTPNGGALNEYPPYPYTGLNENFVLTGNAQIQASYSSMAGEPVFDWANCIRQTYVDGSLIDTRGGSQSAFYSSIGLNTSTLTPGLHTLRIVDTNTATSKSREKSYSFTVGTGQLNFLGTVSLYQTETDYSPMGVGIMGLSNAFLDIFIEVKDSQGNDVSAPNSWEIKFPNGYVESGNLGSSSTRIEQLIQIPLPVPAGEYVLNVTANGMTQSRTYSFSGQLNMVTDISFSQNISSNQPLTITWRDPNPNQMLYLVKVFSYSNIWHRLEYFSSSGPTLEFLTQTQYTFPANTFQAGREYFVTVYAVPQSVANQLPFDLDADDLGVISGTRALKRVRVE